jgi:signal transduction histidine kinase
MIERFVEYTSLNLKQGGSFNPYESCPLEELLAYAIEANSELITKMGFKVTRVFPRETYSVQGDESKVRLVFHHIIQNAVKFGRPGGKVDVDATENEGTITISFVDDGPGIPPREMDYLFTCSTRWNMGTRERCRCGSRALVRARHRQAHGGTIRTTGRDGRDRQDGVSRLPASPDQAGTKDQAEEEGARRSVSGVVRPADSPPAPRPGGLRELG